jgi:hypothetical protein
MYYLTLGIDNDRRLFKAELLDDAASARSAPDYRFVVTTPPQATTDLCILRRSEALQALFTHPTQPPEDLPLSRLRARLDERTAGQIDLILEDAPAPAPATAPAEAPARRGGIASQLAPAPVPTPVPDGVPAEYPADGVLARRGVELVQDGEFIRLRRAAHWAADTDLDVRILFRRGAVTYTAWLRFHLCRPEHLCQAVLDFGSEASQMAYKLAGRSLVQMPLVEIFRDHYFRNYPQDESFRTGFYQHDNDLRFLFRSYYLIREYPDTPDVRTMLHEPPRYEGNVLPLRHDSDEPLNAAQPTAVAYRQIPNLKLLDASLNDFALYFKGVGKQFSNFKDEILLTLLNQFLQALAAEVQSTLDTLGRGAAFERTSLRLTLLVPNLYSQERVLDLSQKLMEGLGTLPEPFFRGLEVQTISESDASFLGFLSDRKINLRADARYLIIDSGKGTTDLSIVRTRPNNPEIVESVYRTGFAGAGNVITYAFLETVLNIVFRGRHPNEARRFLFDRLVRTVKSDHNRLMAVLEHFKRHFPDQPSHNLARVRTIQSGSASLGTLAGASTEALEAGTLIQVLEGIRAADAPLEDYFGLVAETVAELARKIEEHIDYSGEKKIHTVVLAGRAFLFKPFRTAVMERLRQRWKSVEFVFDEGQNAKTHCITGPLNHPGFHHFTDLLGVPSIRKVPGPVPVLNKWLGGENGLFSPPSDDFFERGFSIAEPDTRRVYLGGWEYTVPNNFPLGRSYTLQVLFTRRGLVARALDRLGRVVAYGPLETTHRIAPKDDDALKRSLFPHLRGLPSAELMPLRWVPLAAEPEPPAPAPPAPAAAPVSPPPAVPPAEPNRYEQEKTRLLDLLRKS